MKHPRSLIVLAIFALLSFLIPAVIGASPQNTQQLIQQLANPRDFATIRASTPAQLQTLYDAGNNFYVDWGNGNIESYTIKNGQGGLALHRGRSISPPTEVSISSFVADKMFRSSNAFCVAKDALHKGTMVVKGKNARAITFASNSGCIIWSGPKKKCVGTKTGDVCGANACGSNTVGTCENGLHCSNQRCTYIPDVIPEYQRAVNGSRCTEDKWCKSNKCVYDNFLERNACSGKRPPGQPCTHERECSSGLYCLQYPSDSSGKRIGFCSCKMFSMVNCEHW